MKTFTKILCLWLVFLLGVFFLVVRAEKRVIEPSKGMRILAESAPLEMIQGEFLILPNSDDKEEILQMLSSLNLTLVMPIMNWLLVESKNIKKKIIALNSDEAYEANAVLNTLLSEKLVLDAHHNFVLPPATNDGKTPKKDGHNVLNFFDNGVDLDSIWQYSQGSSSVKVAVIDDFIQRDVFTFSRRFPVCMDRVQLYRPYMSLVQKEALISLPHGEISMLILGACNNHQHFAAGMDKKSKLMAIERPTTGHAQSFLALLFAAGIDVCKESVVPCGAPMDSPRQTADILLAGFGQSAPELLQFSADMLSYINQKGSIVVTPAGNQGMNAHNFFPGGSPGVINVGAHGPKGNRSLFSNWGHCVVALAPGEGMSLTYPDGNKWVEGTSVAASYVAGLLSLMKSLNKNISSNQAKAIIKHTGEKIPCNLYCPDGLFSDGDACKDECCNDDSPCATVGINYAEALRFTQSQKFPWPVISLKNYYVVFRRDDEEKSLTVVNEGDVEARVKIIADDILSNANEEFTISPHGSVELTLSFKKAPFKRSTFQVVLEEKDSLERAFFYIEYVPK